MSQWVRGLNGVSAPDEIFGFFINIDKIKVEENELIIVLVSAQGWTKE